MKEIKFADFCLDEYHTRIARLQEAMDKEGLDALIVTDPSNLRYVFGFQNLLHLSAKRSFVGIFIKDNPDSCCETSIQGRRQTPPLFLFPGNKSEIK